MAYLQRMIRNADQTNRGKASPMSSKGMYTKGMYSAGMYSEADYAPSFQQMRVPPSPGALAFIRHLITGDDNVAIPDYELRPVTSFKSSNTTSLVVNTSTGGNVFYSNGALLIQPRRRGGVTFLGQMRDSSTQVAYSVAPAVNITVPMFVPDIVTGFITTIPDPIDNFKYVRPSAIRWGVSSRTTSTTSAALSGTINAVALGDLNDITSTDVSTYPSIAHTTKDFIQSGPIWDGCIYTAGPELVQNMRQPFSLDTLTTDQDHNSLVIAFGSDAVSPTLPQETIQLLYDIYVGGSTTGASNYDTPLSGLPNDLIQTGFDFDFTGNLIMSLPSLYNFTVQVRLVASQYNSATGGYFDTAILYSTAGALGQANGLTVGTYGVSARMSITASHIEQQLPSSTSTPYTITRITVFLINNSTSEPATLQNFGGSITIPGYYDNINGEACLMQWKNVGIGQEIVIEGSRTLQGVTTGTLSQYLSQSSLANSLSNASPMELNAARALFENPGVHWARRIWTYPFYNGTLLSTDFTVNGQIEHLKAAGLFEDIGNILGGLVPGIGVLARPLLGGLGQVMDKSFGFGSYAIHPGTEYKFSIGEKLAPSGQNDWHSMIQNPTNDKINPVRWGYFVGIDSDGEPRKATIVSSPSPMTSVAKDGEQLSTVYQSVTVCCADGSERTYWLSTNLLAEENSILQAVELLGTLMPTNMYVTDTCPSQINGASYGLAMTIALLGLPNNRITTGVVKYENSALNVHPVESLILKATLATRTGAKMVYPIANDEILTTDLDYSDPFMIMTGGKLTQFFGITTVQDMLMLENEGAAHIRYDKRTSRAFATVGARLRNGLHAADTGELCVGDPLPAESVMFPMICVKGNTYSPKMGAVVKWQPDQKVVNAKDNPHLFKGARLLTLRNDNGLWIIESMTQQILGRSWELAYGKLHTGMVLYDIDADCYSGKLLKTENSHYVVGPVAFWEHKMIYAQEWDMTIGGCGSTTTAELSPLDVLKDGYHSADFFAGMERDPVAMRWAEDLVNLASRSPAYKKLVDIFEFLEQTETLQPMYDYVRRNTAETPNGEPMFYATALHDFIVKSESSKVPTKQFEAHNKQLAAMQALKDIGATASGNAANDFAMLNKAKRLATNANSMGIPVDAAWVAANGYRGPSTEQIAYFKNTGKVLQNPKEMTGYMSTGNAGGQEKSAQIAQSIFGPRVDQEKIQMVKEYMENNGGKGPTSEVVKSWTGAEKRNKVKPQVRLGKQSRFRSGANDLE